jgi:hypothetical protein
MQRATTSARLRFRSNCRSSRTGSRDQQHRRDHAGDERGGVPLFNADRLTIYSVAEDKQSIVSKVKTG